MMVVLVTSDLMVVSRVEGAVRHSGAALTTFARADQAAACCAEQRVDLLLVDLSSAALDVRALVDQLHAADRRAPSVVAFGPHVHNALLAAADQAGCDEVVSRGQFFAQLETILARHLRTAE